MTARDLPEDDIGRVLGLFGPATWLLYGLCVFTVGYLALVLGGAPAHSPLGIAALVAVLAALLLIVTPSPTPLPAWRVWVILGVIVAVTAAITWQQPFHDRPPLYLAWELNPCDLLMFCLALRGRILAAWIGQAAMLATASVWSVTVTGAPWYGLSFTYTQPFPLLAVTVFAIGLHRTAGAVIAHRAAAAARAAREALAAAADTSAEAELRGIRDLAAPTLEQIASGQEPDPTAVRVLEAALRDRIRGRNLAVEPLTAVLQSVRSAGVDVVVLDDLGEQELSNAQRRMLAGWVADRIVGIRAASVTARLSPGEDDGVLATLAVDGEPSDECALDPSRVSAGDAAAAG